MAEIDRAHLAALLEINRKLAAIDPASALPVAIAEEAVRLLDVAGAEVRLAGRGEGAEPAGLAELGLSAGPAGPGTALGVALRVGGRTVGVLSLRSSRPFAARDVELAEALADQAAVAIEQTRLYREASRQAERMAALAEVERLLVETLDPATVARRIVDSLCRLLDVPTTVLFRLRAGSGELESLAVSRDSYAGPGGIVLPPGVGIAGLTVREGRPMASPDVLADPRVALPADVRARVEASGHAARLGIPLVVRGRVIGAISAADRAGRVFDDGDLALARAFADQAAVALENARLHEESERRRREAEAIQRIATTLTEELGLAAVSERITDSIVTLLGVAASSIRLLEPDGSLRAIAYGGTARRHLAPGDVQPPGLCVAGRAVAEGRAVQEADQPAAGAVVSPAMRALIEQAGLRSVLALPLRARGRPLGVLVASDAAVRRYTDGEIALAQTFADHAAVALENARLHDEADRRRHEAEVIAEVARTANASLDLGTVLERVAAAARELCGSDTARIALPVPGGEGFAFRHVVGRGPGDDAAAIKVGRGTTGLVLATGAPAMGGAPGESAELAVPIRSGERVEGVLHVAGGAGRLFTARDEAVLVRLADHAGVAIRNAFLYAAAEGRAEQLRTLARLTRAVSSSLDAEEVLAAIVRAAAQLVGAAYATIWVAEPADRVLRMRASSDEAVTRRRPVERLRFGEGIVGWVAAHARGLTVPDVARDDRVVAREWLVAEGLTSLHAVPIVLQDTLLGVLTLAQRDAFTLGADEHDLLDAFVGQAAVALDHARRYAETRRRLEETRALLEVAELLNATLDSRRLMRRLAVKIAQVCAVDRCSVLLWEGGRTIALMSQFADGHRDDAQWAGFLALPPRAPQDVPAHARVTATRRPVLVEDARTSDLLPREWADAFGLGAVLVVPLVRQDQVIGVMHLDYCDRRGVFEPWQVDRALTIAGSVALSLENARLYGEVRDRLRETSTLLAVGGALSLPAPLAERLRLVAREVGRALGAGTAGIYALDAAREALVPVAGHRVPRHLLGVFLERPFALARMPRVAEAWRTGQTVWSPDLAADPRVDPAMVAGLDPRALLLVPTRVRGDSVGAIMLVWWEPGRTVTPGEIRLVEGVATQLGLALENAELARRTEGRLRESETLLAVSQELSGTRDVETAFRKVLEHVVRAVDATGAGVWAPGGGDEALTLESTHGIEEARIGTLRRIPLTLDDSPALAEAVRTRRPVLVADLGADPRIAPAWREATGAASEVIVPVVGRERLLGAIRIFWSVPRPWLGAEQAALLEAIAGQAAVAIENARLFESNTRQLAELSVLYELSRAVTGQFDRRALVESMATQIGRIVDARNLTILLAEERRQELEVVYRTHRGERDREPANLLGWPGIGLVSVVLRSGAALRTDDYVAACAQHGVEPVAGAAALPYWLGVPMVAGRRALGVLALAGAERPFTEGDQRLLTNVAHLAALALRSARLFDELAAAYADLATAQDQLVRTERLRALGEMASGVAHDFNNLLAAILGRAQLLLRMTEDDRIRGGLQIIERASQDGAQTVRRLQEFARVRQDEPRVAVDLNDVVRDALALTQSHWRDEAPGRGGALDVRTELTPVPPITGDPAELREAVASLVLNAVDAMPEGGTLVLGTGVGEDGVEVRVSDTGAGVPDAIRDKIFDPFFTTKGPRGTGLGLSLTYGIVSRHGGRVTVDSAEDRGSTFRITFPSRRPDAAAPAAPPAAPRTPPVASLRCLVVDDEPEVAALIGECLESDGHRVVVLTEGRAAVERLGVEPFDLVITDLAMTGASGWDVAAAAHAGTPVLLVSGFGVELSAEDRQRQGIAEVLAKPIRVEQLTAAVARVAEARQHAGEETT